MPKFKIVIEDIQTVIREKMFEAPTLEEAQYLAELEDWSMSDWQEIDGYSRCEFREDLCVEVKD